MDEETSKVDDPFLQATEDNRGGTVILASSLFMILGGSVVVVTLISRVKKLKTLIPSDWILIASTVLSVTQSLCINLACEHGLGKHRDALDDASYMAYSKFLYAGQILAVLSLSGAKLSATYLIVTIKPFRMLWMTCMAVIVAVAAWTVVGVISLAVQCDIPQPWHFKDERCVDQRALYLGLGTISILIDIVLVALPIVLVRQVQLSITKRLTIMALFSSRIVLPIFTIVTLTQFEAFIKSPDKPWDAVQSSIWLQATLGLSLVTTCVPNLKRVLESLQSGLMAGKLPEFYEFSRPKDAAADGYTTGSKRTGGRSARRLSTGQSKAKESDTVCGYLRPDYSPTKGHGFINSIIGGKKGTRKNSHGDSESVENLTAYGITQTIAYEVEYGDRTEARPGNNQTGSSSMLSSETRVD